MQWPRVDVGPTVRLWAGKINGADLQQKRSSIFVFYICKLLSLSRELKVRSSKSLAITTSVETVPDFHAVSISVRKKPNTTSYFLRSTVTGIDSTPCYGLAPFLSYIFFMFHVVVLQFARRQPGWNRPCDINFGIGSGSSKFILVLSSSSTAF